MPWVVLVGLTGLAVALGVSTEPPSASLAVVPISGLYLVWRRVGRPALALRALAQAMTPDDPVTKVKSTDDRRRGQAPAKPRPQPDRTGLDDVTATAERLLVQGRTALLRRPEMDEFIGPALRIRVSRATETAACFVCPGPVLLENFEAGELGRPGSSPTRRLWVDAFRIDRYAVTNADYLEFVADGGYGRPETWDAAIRGRLARLVDRTGRPGPRYWSRGSFPADEARLPVVGICWYEADAYARWAGKRLPTCGEWVRAALMPTGSLDTRIEQQPFPWGEAHDIEPLLVARFDPRSTASLRQAQVDDGPAGLVPVDVDPAPPAPSGAVQMVGNVWEWTSGDFPGPDFDRRLLADDRVFKTIRGGALDTYHLEMARPASGSGDLITARRPNVGFRCAWDA